MSHSGVPGADSHVDDEEDDEDVGDADLDMDDEFRDSELFLFVSIMSESFVPGWDGGVC